MAKSKRVSLSNVARLRPAIFHRFNNGVFVGAVQHEIGYPDPAGSRIKAKLAELYEKDPSGETAYKFSHWTVDLGEQS
jgi:hypothetical protein